LSIGETGQTQNDQWNVRGSGKHAVSLPPEIRTGPFKTGPIPG
jgi:hypothetical protein